MKRTQTIQPDIFCTTYETCFEPVTITCSQTSLLSVHFGTDRPLNVRAEQTPFSDMVLQQLQEYFQGRRKQFDIPLHMTGTDFQKKVWRTLLEIPYGETRSYGEIAAAIGNPRASRAVGMANHNNPIAIIVPCHRVIGANGSLTGYAGGLDIKKRLLELETISF